MKPDTPDASSGQTSEDNSAISPPAQTPVPEAKQRKLSKKQLLIIAAVIGLTILAAVIAAAIILNRPNQNQEYPGTQAETQKTSNQPQLSDDEDKKEDAEKTAPETQPISETCLAPIDAHDFFGVDKNYLPSDVTRYFYSETVYFKADSAEYSNIESTKVRYDKLAEFYKRYSKKNFIYYVQATTYEDNTSSQGVQVAQSRADTAKKELSDRGIPVAIIMIEQPRTSTYNAEGMRNVIITIRGSKNC